MHLAHLRLRDFRNYARLDQEFGPGFHLLLGNNAQGKTNLLEAIYLIATLRSFRGVGGAQIVRQGRKAYFIGATIVAGGEHRTKMYWSATQRSLELDARPVKKLTDYLGTLRTVVFCTEDLQLPKGSSSVRRRFLDLLLSQTHPYYLALLQRYTKALRSRNAILKRPIPDPRELDGFSRELVQAGAEMIRMRRELTPRISPLAAAAYQAISNGAEELRLAYRSSVKEDFQIELAQSRSRESACRFTLIGPHRDDLDILLDGRLAAQFGSEGQKRTIAIALKMAQAEHVAAVRGSPPVLLIDDIMGELDASRRRGLLPLLERTHRAGGQAFMTATEIKWPEDLMSGMQHWQVAAGAMRKA